MSTPGTFDTSSDTTWESPMSAGPTAAPIATASRRRKIAPPIETHPNRVGRINCIVVAVTR